MRVIAGSLKGRSIAAPKGYGTRPTTDRVREAMFSALASLIGTDFSDLTVLDAFAGSGGLGIESLSRGAERAVFIERDPRAYAVLSSNVERMGLSSRAQLLKGDAFSLAKRHARGPFSLILLDPPYTLDAGRTASLLTDLIQAGSVASGCVVIWEHGRDTAPSWPGGFAGIMEKHYASTAVSFGRFIEGESG